MGEVIKINTSIKKLDISDIDYNYCPHILFQIIDNKFGIEGGKAIAEGLKINTSLTEFDISTK